jgi:hypothetical protein
MEVVDAVIAWVRANPTIAAGGAIAILAVFWFLRRPDPVLSKGQEDVAKLTDQNRGKYDKLRSLK